MAIELVQSTLNPDTVLVRVDAGDLKCGFNEKPLPYPTYVGTISRATRKVSVWTPAAYKPRGYREAALRLLEEQAEQLLPEAHTLRPFPDLG